MMNKVRRWFSGLSVIGKVAAISVLGFSTVALAAPHTALPAPQSAAPAASIQSQPEPPKVKSETVKTETTTEAVPFSEQSVDDPGTLKGLSYTKQEGVAGVKTKTFRVTYQDNKEVGRQLISESVTAAPINKIIAHGSKEAQQPSCPNGTYINAYGNEVCRPYETQQTPAGATAQCVDGTYSFSQTHRGTCSHHGGVASWL